ncbi:hypothetical protein MUK42_35628 [Musa troglodytarum]|uniref:Uncharacterized protein n=1 Tax=Musa troglodytarum TaxID=320322 RepID=A0A9E7GJJ8_9LILI|nr:hypothetical protein MUK42_35628 [Musa troglodytarum]
MEKQFCDGFLEELSEWELQKVFCSSTPIPISHQIYFYDDGHGCSFLTARSAESSRGDCSPRTDLWTSQAMNSGERKGEARRCGRLGENASNACAGFGVVCGGDLPPWTAPVR